MEVLTLARGHHARRRVFWLQRSVNRGGPQRRDGKAGTSGDSPQRFTDEEERRHDVRWSDASDKSAAGTPRRRSFESSIGDSVGAAVVASDIVVDEAVLFRNADSKMMTVRPATFVSAPLRR